MNKIKSYSVLFILTLLLSFCIASDLKAQTYDLEKVEDTNSPIPMGTGNFTDLISPVWLGDWDVTFRGIGPNNQQGIYTVIDGTLAKVADTNTAIPDGSGQFSAFGGTTIWLGGKDLAFGASGTNQRGIYALIDGTLTKIVDNSTEIPMGTGDFLGFNAPVALDAGNMAFRADGESGGQVGIYSSIDGTIAKVVDTNTAIPMGTGNFTQFNSPSHLGNQDIGFQASGSSSQVGLYTVIDGTLSKVADTSTAIPMGTGNFTNFGTRPISLGGGDVAFIGFGAGGQGGIYRSIGGTLSKVADFNTPVPMGTGNFNLFSISPVSIGGGNLIFAANGTNSESGIYSFIDGTLAKIVDKNTPIPMGTGNFTAFSFSLTSLGDGDIAFEGFGNGEEGIYAFVGGTLIKIADDSTAIPMGMGDFNSFNGQQSAGAKDLVFAASGSSDFEGIYKAFFSYTLDINLAGNGSGNVSAPGIDCGDGGVDCTENYLPDTEVTLVATPDAVSTFEGFTGPGCDTGMVLMDQDRTCTATFDFLPLLLGPIFPGVASNPNSIEVEQASPNGRVAFLWGFMPGSTIVNGPTCNGIELGMNDPRLLGFAQAGEDQTAEFIVYIPLNAAFQNPVLVQAVDIPTCRTSEVVTNIILSN